jgi:hypothetical protein
VSSERTLSTLHGLYSQALTDAQIAWNERGALMTQSVHTSHELLALHRQLALQSEDTAKLHVELSRLRKDNLTKSTELEQVRTTVHELQVALAEAYEMAQGDEPAAPVMPGGETSIRRRRVENVTLETVQRLELALQKMLPQAHLPVNDQDSHAYLDVLSQRLLDAVRKHSDAVQSAAVQSSVQSALATATETRLAELLQSNAALRSAHAANEEKLRDMTIEAETHRRIGTDKALANRHSQLLAQLPLALVANIRGDRTPLRIDAMSWADALQCVSDLGTCCLALEQALLLEKDNAITTAAEHRRVTAKLAHDTTPPMRAPVRDSSVQTAESSRPTHTSAVQVDTVTDELRSAIALAAERAMAARGSDHEVERLSHHVTALQRALVLARRQQAALDQWSHEILSRDAQVRPAASRFRVVGHVIAACVRLRQRRQRAPSEECASRAVTNTASQFMPRLLRKSITFGTPRPTHQPSPPKTRAASLDGPHGRVDPGASALIQYTEWSKAATWPDHQPWILHTAAVDQQKQADLGGNHTPPPRGAKEDFPTVSPSTGRRSAPRARTTQGILHRARLVTLPTEASSPERHALSKRAPASLNTSASSAHQRCSACAEPEPWQMMPHSMLAPSGLVASAPTTRSPSRAQSTLTDGGKPPRPERIGGLNKEILAVIAAMDRSVAETLRS